MRALGTRRTLLLPTLACLLLAGCGGTQSSGRAANNTVTVLMAEAPNSLDPAVAETPQALEADYQVYTPLLTYNHSSGVPGTEVNPGLATMPPTVTDDGRTYSLTLQPGLVYSDGEPVKASDFTWSVERAIRLGWARARQLITSRIVGAAGFAAGRAKGISGISTDDATGQITIRLLAPWGLFDSVLALPVMAPVPSSTPLRDEQSAPPPGVGPYELTSVVPGHSFSLVLNPRWRPGRIPGIPPGHVDVAVRITGDARQNALRVLDDTADVFDPADKIPAALLPRILRRASTRYSKQALNDTYAIFMNVTRKPFSSALARIAVQTALDDNTLKQLGAGLLQQGCYLLPPSMYGHPHDQCPRGNIKKGGDEPAGRALVARSGMAGTRVTVWGESGAPASSWMAYYTSLLNRLGFRAQLKLVPSSSYAATVGDLKLHPQTGFGYFAAALASPVDLYERMTGAAIRPRANLNLSEANDPYLNHQVGILSAVPSTNLPAIAPFWHSLERYVANRAYLAVFGYETAPEFVSDRVNYAALHLSPVFGLDWSSFHLK